MSAVFPGRRSLESYFSSLPRHLGLQLQPLYLKTDTTTESILQMGKLRLS